MSIDAEVLYPTLGMKLFAMAGSGPGAEAVHPCRWASASRQAATSGVGRSTHKASIPAPLVMLGEARRCTQLALRRCTTAPPV